ncbi:MAG: glycosyl hydrolase family 25 [Bacteroidales bacterium]|nr:glycosyl hydrolase family 25 [Candidatus Physcousia equi]
MSRYSTILLAAILFLLPCISDAKKKKEKAVEVRPELPMPDPAMVALKPQIPLSPIGELGRIEAANPKATYGNHTARHHGGIDVSHYQGQIDWQAVAREGKTKYVFCKATESTTLVDNTFQYNLREAKRAGIPVGCYHFFSATTSGEAQLRHFMKNVDVRQLDVVPMLDVEVRGKASLEEFHRQIRAWLKGFEEHYHFKPILYASVNFYNKYLAGAFDDYIYMIAKYGEGCPNPQGAIPFAMWQYTSSGSVSGIRGRVDLSCFVDHFDVKDILIKNQR